MNRRAFFAALAAIPTVAKWLKPKRGVVTLANGSSIFFIEPKPTGFYQIGDEAAIERYVQECGRRAFETQCRLLDEFLIDGTKGYYLGKQKNA